MSRVIWADDAASVLAEPVYPGDVSLVVTAPERFPVLRTGHWCYLTLEAAIPDENGRVIKETVRVTRADGPRWLIERAQGHGEVPLHFSIGDVVELRVCSPLLEDMYQETLKAVDGVVENSRLLQTLAEKIEAIEADGPVQDHEGRYAAIEHSHDYANEGRYGLVRKATDIEADTGSENSAYITALQMQRRLNRITHDDGVITATEENYGAVEFADELEMQDTSNSQRVISPQRLHELVVERGWGSSIPTLIPTQTLSLTKNNEWESVDLSEYLPAEARVASFFISFFGRKRSEVLMRHTNGDIIDGHMVFTHYLDDDLNYLASSSTSVNYPLNGLLIDIKRVHNNATIQLWGWM